MASIYSYALYALLRSNQLDLCSVEDTLETKKSTESEIPGFGLDQICDHCPNFEHTKNCKKELKKKEWC